MQCQGGTVLDQDALLDLSVDIGCSLLESAQRFTGPRIRSDDCWRPMAWVRQRCSAIPNCIIASVTTPEGRPITRVRRIPNHGTDLQQLELYNGLCRRLCRETPAPETARAWMLDLETQRRHYSAQVQFFGYFLGTASFSLFFGGNLWDALCGGLCGLAIAVVIGILGRLDTGVFFRTLVAAAVSAALAVTFVQLGLGHNLDAITIGAFMSLTPGVALTNSMREFMAGDMVSGVSRLTEALLIATAIALSTGVVLALSGTAL